MTEKIINAVSGICGVAAQQITCRTARKHTRAVVEAKQLCVYFLWKYTDLPLIKIAAAVGAQSRQYAGFCKSQITEIASGDKGLQEKIKLIQDLVIRK